MQRIPRMPDTRQFAYKEVVEAQSKKGVGMTARHAEHQYHALFYLFNSILIGTAVVHVTTYVDFFKGIQPTVALFVLGMGPCESAVSCCNGTFSIHGSVDIVIVGRRVRT